MKAGATAQGAELVAVAALTGAINFACIVYAGRKLAPAEYADFWTALSVVFVVTMLLNSLAPFASHVAASSGDRNAVAAFRSVAMRRLAMLAGGLLILGAAIAPRLASLLHFQSSWSLFPAIASTAVYGFLVTDRGLLQGLHNFRAYNVNAVIEASLRLIGIVAALALSPTAAAATTAYLLGLVAAELLLQPAMPRSELPAESPDTGSIALPIFVFILGACVLQNVDTFAVKRWLPAAAGDYAAAAVFSRISTALFAPLYVLLVPAIARERGQGRPVAAALRIAGSYLGLSGLLLAAFAYLAQPLSQHLLGPQYTDAPTLIVPIAGMLTVANVALLITQALVSIGATRVLFAYGTLVAAAILGLVRYHGTIGEVLGVLYAANGMLLVVMLALLAMQGRRLA